MISTDCLKFTCFHNPLKLKRVKNYTSFQSKKTGSPISMTPCIQISKNPTPTPYVYSIQIRIALLAKSGSVGFQYFTQFG